MIPSQLGVRMSRFGCTQISVPRDESQPHFEKVLDIRREQAKVTINYPFAKIFTRQKPSQFEVEIEIFDPSGKYDYSFCADTKTIIVI